MVTRKYLQENPRCIFVFGDNLLRRGYGGAAVLRDEPNSYGFITKKAPDNLDASFFTLDDYAEVEFNEERKLEILIQNNRNRIFLVSAIGSGLANKYKIYEEYIHPWRERLPIRYNNVHLV